MRPAPGLLASFKEVLSRTAVVETKGGASKLARPALKFQRPIHLPQPGSGARHASSAAHPTSWRAAVNSFVESVYAGTFKAVRSSATARPGPYSASRLPPRPSSSSGPFARAAPRPLTSSARARFGPSPRPHAGHSTPRTAHAGLGAARQFSSAGFGVWDNVVLNAPLALRALADQCDGGIDRRKWRKETAGIRRAARTDVKGKGRAPAGWDAMEEKKREFERFFGAAASGAVAEGEIAQPVTLVLAIDPDFDLAVSSASSSTSADPSTFRVLSASALDSFASITSAYSSHAHRLRVVLNRLSAAGLLDPELRASTEVGVAPAGSEHAGRRVWRVVFEDGLVTRSRVERVVRGEEDAPCAAGDAPAWAEKVRSWSRQSAVAAGEGDWWWLLGGGLSPAASPLEASFAPALDTPAFPLSPASVSAPASIILEDDDSSAAFLLDAAHALAVAETFVLPDPSASALSSRSPSSFASVIDDGGDVAEQPGWATWAYDSASTASLLAEESLDPAASAWAESDEGSFWDEGSDEGSVVALGEDEGVRGFLREVEVELGARGGGRW
ncbi:hypothetical protein JCM10450v2_001793 [Rhodotorula kratochvilovae]